MTLLLHPAYRQHLEVAATLTSQPLQGGTADLPSSCEVEIEGIWMKWQDGTGQMKHGQSVICNWYLGINFFILFLIS